MTTSHKTSRCIYHAALFSIKSLSRKMVTELVIGEKKIPLMEALIQTHTRDRSGSGGGELALN